MRHLLLLATSLCASCSIDDSTPPERFALVCQGNSLSESKGKMLGEKVQSTPAHLRFVVDQRAGTIHMLQDDGRLNDFCMTATCAVRITPDAIMGFSSSSDAGPREQVTSLTYRLEVDRVTGSARWESTAKMQDGETLDGLSTSTIVLKCQRKEAPAAPIAKI